MTIVIVGMHGAGKTTLGAALATRLGLPFHGEIGRALAEDPGFRPPDRTAEDPQDAFDEAVFRRELARDAAWEPGRTRIVETWHPGNLAYAAHRSPGVVARHREAIRSSIARHPAVVLPVRVPASVARARQSEPGDLTFFQEVGAEAERLAFRLGLRVLAPVLNAGAVASSLEAALTRLSPFLSEST